MPPIMNLFAAKARPLAPAASAPVAAETPPPAAQPESDHAGHALTDAAQAPSNVPAKPRESDKLPANIRDFVSLHLTALRDHMRAFEGVLAARGDGYNLALEWQDRKEKIAQHEAALGKFMSMASQKGVNVLAVYGELGGKPDFAMISERSDELVAAQTLKFLKAGDELGSLILSDERYRPKAVIRDIEVRSDGVMAITVMTRKTSGVIPMRVSAANLLRAIDRAHAREKRKDNAQDFVRQRTAKPGMGMSMSMSM